MNISIPISIKTIDNDAFSYSGLTTIEYKGITQPQKCFDAFTNTSITFLDVPSNFQDEYFCGLNFLFDSGVCSSSSSECYYNQYLNGSMFIRGSGNITVIPQYSSFIRTLNISLNSISWDSFFFSGKSFLKILEIKTNRISFGAFAFNNCLSLEFVYIKSSSITMKAFSFSDCIGLKYLKLSTTSASFDAFAFHRSSLLQYIIFEGSKQPSFDAFAFEEAHPSIIVDKYYSSSTFFGFKVSVLNDDGDKAITTGSCGNGCNFEFEAFNGVLELL